jgi:MerR family transcriptional regulator, thiopeptide resistance regulator
VTMTSEFPVGGGRRIGELASSSGLTVRTLHHYEDIGLLVASTRTAAGHRLYSDADVERLYRISLLRQIGLPLGKIAHMLDDPAWNVRAALATHLSEVERQLAAGARVRARLLRLVSNHDESGPMTEDLLKLLEEMTMLESMVQSRISILVYTDLEAMFAELTDVFGLGPGELTRDATGRVVHGELHAGDGMIWLHPESAQFGLSSPRTLGATTATTAVMVDDVDAHFRHASSHGASIVYEPVDQPYGYREYSAHDSEGALWSFMKPLA